jgi:hypothetical protein
MRHKGLSPINRARFNWRRLWGEPIGWVWLAAFLLHLVALFCVQDFVFFKGMSAEAHGLFIAQSLRFPATEKSESNLNSNQELEISTAPVSSKLNSVNLEKKKEEEKTRDLPQWNPLAQLPSGVPKGSSKRRRKSPLEGLELKYGNSRVLLKKLFF